MAEFPEVKAPRGVSRVLLVVLLAGLASVAPAAALLRLPPPGDPVPTHDDAHRAINAYAALPNLPFRANDLRRWVGLAHRYLYADAAHDLALAAGYPMDGVAGVVYDRQYALYLGATGGLWDTVETPLNIARLFDVVQTISAAAE